MRRSTGNFEGIVEKVRTAGRVKSRPRVGLVVTVGTIVFLFAVPARAFDDFQTWSTVAGNYVHRDKLTLAVGAEVRLREDSSRAWFARLSQQARYRLNDRWTFDGNLSYLRLRAQDVFDLDALRLELAVTPSWKFGQRTGFDLRNRVDVLVREGDADDDVILRLRPRLTVRLGETVGRRKLFLGTEVLFSGSLGQVFQNRLYPVGASFPVGPRARVELYLMVFSVRISDEWRHDLVLGQSWVF